MKSGIDLRAMIDYLRLSFFGTDYKTVIQRVLRMDLTEFETRPTGLYLLTVFLFVGISGCSGIQNEL